MNVNPFRRRHRDAAESPVEAALRRSLARNAFDAPDADELTRRILAAAERTPDRPGAVREERPARGPWKTWGLPLVAAVSVAAVVGVGAAVASYHPGDDHGRQAASDVPSTAHTTVTRTQTVTAPATPSGVTQGSGTSGLKNVKILDLTFFGTNDGIALASAHCRTGPGRCTALLQTSDGHTWTAKGGGIDFDVEGVEAGCPASKCVDHIRFANSQDGYAYGPQALFMTTDGGDSWHQQSGGADAIETLSGNVIRVSSANPSGCPPGCVYTVQTASIGSPHWTTVPLPGGTPYGDGVQLSRGGTNAYLLVTQNPAGGSNDERSTLYTSSDNGARWTDVGEPCPQSGSESDSYQVAAGAGEDVTVLCRARESGPFRVAVSTDGGTHFTMRHGTIAYPDVANAGFSSGALPSVLAGDPSTVLAVAGRGVALSRSGGATWTQAGDLVGRFATVGFESTTVGRAVSADGSQIWTTRNAGRTWHESTP